MTEAGAKGPKRRERESQKRRDLRGSDWKKRRERRRRMEEMEMVIKRNGLLGFWWVCGESVNEEEEGFGRAWKRNLGLASSSKNSIVGQRSRSRHLPQTLLIILLLMINVWDSFFIAQLYLFIFFLNGG